MDADVMQKSNSGCREGRKPGQLSETDCFQECIMKAVRKLSGLAVCLPGHKNLV